MIRIPQNVEYILAKLQNAGFEANIVGGCVRDYILARSCCDYDVTTNATPQETKALFKSERIIETGIKHGTVTLYKDGENYEITTYRLDGEYLDNRHPSEVKFTKSLRDDTSRRDFTMNAVCYNPRDGFSDFHGGIEDIKNGIIRTVGDPYQRFREDALRILRAIRFSAVLGFSIEAETEKALFALSNLLENISRERVYVEWKKLLQGEFSYSVLKKYKDIIAICLPGADFDNLPAESLYKNAGYTERNVSLFKSARDYERAMRALRTDSKIIKTGVSILSNIDKKTSTRIDILRVLRSIDVENTELLIKTKILLSLSSDDELSLFNLLISDGVPYKISSLKINGRDIESLGVKGTEIGRVLSLLLDEVIEGKTENEREALLLRVNKITKDEYDINGTV